MINAIRTLIIATAFFALACSKTSVTDDTPSHACVPLTTSSSIGSGNVVPVTVGCGYPNEPCVTVKICVPGTTTCQTIDHILLDTGSYGLRLFTCAISIPLPNQLVAGKQLAECVSYADQSSDWGPVKLADIYLTTNETTSTGIGVSTGTPIQVIDPNYMPNFIGSGGCGTPDFSPAMSGFNGIMGIGLFQNDCPTCAGTANPNATPYYANCDASTGTCQVSTAGQGVQVTNPISLLQPWNPGTGPQTDNNGTILEINSLGGNQPLGLPSATGNLILGLDTGPAGSNNDTSATGPLPHPANMYPADPGFGTFQTDYQGTGDVSPKSYPYSFVDSGSNLWDFPDSMNQCPGDLAGTGIFCPGGVKNLQATPYINNNPGPPVSFQVTDGSVITNGNGAFNTVGAYFGGLCPDFCPSGPDSFDFGLPFYFGRKICTGIKGKTDTRQSWGPAAPYWAW